MTLFSEKQAIIEGLEALRSIIHKKKSAEAAIEQHKSKKNKLKTDAANSGKHVQLLPTDHYSTQKRAIDDNYINATDKKERTLKLWLNVAIIALGIIMIGILYLQAKTAGALSIPNAESGEIVATNSESMETICLIFSIIATISLFVFANTERWAPYEGWEFFSLGGILFFMFCWWAPFLSVILSIVGMYKIHLLLAVLPVVMVGCMLFRKQLVRNGLWMSVGRYTPKEQAELDAAAALDKDNEKVNTANQQAAVTKSNEAIRDNIAQLDAQIAALQKEIQELNRIIDDNEYLGPTQLGKLDIVIKRLRGGEAETVKEALQQIEEENRRQEEERRRQEAEIRAKMPGRVNITVGSINTYSGKLQDVRNSIYIDGQLYGSANSIGTVVQLNPGPHTIFAQLQEAGYIFTSQTSSFILNGDAEINVLIKLDYGNVYMHIT